MTLQSNGSRVSRQGRHDPVAKQIAALSPWFHNLHLPSGHETAPDHPLGDFPAFKWDQLAGSLPSELTGMRALDVGCNAGYYSFELAARGAEVLAIDSDEHYLRQARWAAEQLDPEGRVSFRHAQLYELARTAECFDLILFLGVLYHLRYPLLALDLIAGLTRGTMVLQTMTMPGQSAASAVPDDLPISQRQRLARPGWPHAAFIEHQLADDPTNWWVADDACVQAMLRSAGLRIVDTPGHELYVCVPDPGHDHAASIRTAELHAALGVSSSPQGGGR